MSKGVKKEKICFSLFLFFRFLFFYFWNFLEKVICTNYLTIGFLGSLR
jgi:hypothetical protein